MSDFGPALNQPESVVAVEALQQGSSESCSVHDNAMKIIASNDEFCRVSVKKGKTPIDMTAVRRSSRANKYDGFKIHLPSDAKVVKSKVKPRLIPSVKTISMAAAPQKDVTGGTILPPAKSVKELQHTGTLCGIAPNDLTPEKLLASKTGDDAGPN